MEVTHEQLETKGSFYIAPDKERLAEMTYSKAGASMIIIDHTEISEQLRGQGVGKKLVLAAVDWARESNKRVLPLCPFAKSVFNKTPEIRDVL
ncbi:MAG: GNAT family N-acetyltransferase [Bacteroidota bacterium]